MVKSPPAIQETLVCSLGWDDPLEEGMATHSSILAWRIPVGRGAWPTADHRVAESRTWLSGEAHTQASISPVTRLSLKRLMVWGLVFLGQNSWLGWLMWGLDPFPLRDNLWNCDYPPFCGLLSWGCGYWLYCIFISPFLLAVVHFFVSLVVENIFCYSSSCSYH